MRPPELLSMARAKPRRPLGVGTGESASVTACCGAVRSLDNAQRIDLLGVDQTISIHPFDDAHVKLVIADRNAPLIALFPRWDVDVARGLVLSLTFPLEHVVIVRHEPPFL